MNVLATQYEDGEYLEKVPDWHAADAPWKAGKILRLLRRNLLAPTSVCDVGCGAGGVLAQLQPGLPSTTQLRGYDISGHAIRLCKPRENDRLRFQQGDFLREPSEPFELLLLLDVLEHVPDYLGFLSALRGRARRFVFHIPLDLSVHTVAGGSRHLLSMRNRYGHLHYFTAETARSTLADAGYRIEDACYTWDNEAEGWPPLAAGWKARLKYPLRCAAYGLERAAFRLDPDATARFLPAYNLLVLATAAEGASLNGTALSRA